MFKIIYYSYSAIIMKTNFVNTNKNNNNICGKIRFNN